ncbi:MAG: hypothetical protein GTO18_04710 [Anaerolineales bacterium]|nr:hypothetical protein [Anaerolineales bacterium]
MESKNIWIVIAIILFFGACICCVVISLLFGVGLATREFIKLIPTETPIALVQPTAVPSETVPPTTEDTPPSTDTATPTESSSTYITPELSAEMDELQNQVEELRGLEPTGPVKRTLLTPEELRENVINDFFEDYTEEEARDDARVLALMGLLDEDFDLYNFYIDLYSEQVAGYYDDELEQMFVVQGVEFGGTERLTYTHEYNHVLQDQTFDIEEGLNLSDEACEDDGERCSAIIALLEGDAVLLEEQWLRTYATTKDYSDILEFYENFESPVYDSAPAFLQDDLLFPYIYGIEFVSHEHMEGGWPAVDELYRNPPTTTEHILHPGRYPWDQPRIIQAPDLTSALGNGWREIEIDVLGEWYTHLMLSEYIDQDVSFEAAEGWGGDTYVALYQDDLNEGSILLLTTWDTVDDAREFFGAFTDYGDERFGAGSKSINQATWDTAGENVLFELWGNQTLWILSPNAETTDRIREAVEFPIPE